MMHYRGWKPDIPDQRDHVYSVPFIGVLPIMIDLRPTCPPVYDQEQLGSCTANAIAAAIEFDRKKQGLPDFTPSRLFIYYFTRQLEHTVPVDAGATLRDTVKVVAKEGACPEDEWPYTISQFAIEPPIQDFKDALLDRALSYQRITRSLAHMKACLASGYPFAVGISVYESFEGDEPSRTGVIPMPQQNEQLLGGHAILICGYRDSDRKWIFRNSWGDAWGDSGYGYLDYQYLLDKGLSSDFWVIKWVG